VSGHYGEHLMQRGEAFMSAFELFKRHRDKCWTCRIGHWLFGPLCPKGIELRNRSIDETGNAPASRESAGAGG
jgi:hypothetical protein